MKKMFKLALLLSIVFFTSCEKDLYDEPIHSEKSKIIMRDFSINELSSKSNTKLLKKVNELKVRNNKQMQHQDGKIVYDSINNFYFDDENGKYIEKGDSKSYVFPVFRANSDLKIEKVIFSQMADGDYKMYLAKYNLTDEQLNSLNQQEASNIDVAYTDITNKFGIQLGIMCFQTWEYLNTGDLVGADSHAQYEWVVTGEKCLAINAEQSTDMGGSGNGETSQGGVIISSPSGAGAPLTPSQFHAIVHGEFISMMSDEQHNWWINPSNISSTASITNFLTTHNYSISNENYVYQLIDMSIANNSNFTFNNSLNDTNSQVFNSISELQDFFNSQSNDCSDIDYDVFGNQKTARIKLAKAGPFGGVNFSIKQNITPTYSVVDVTSSAYGFTVAFSWDQTNFDSSITGNVATVNIEGNIHYNVVFQGIGTVWTEHVKLQVKLNTTNGTIISANVIP